MDKNFDFTTMELILQRITKDDNPALKVVVNDLILISRKAGRLGFTMKEIANLCTLGFVVSQEPELESMLQYLLSRTMPTDDILN